jgi:hypothetical protein
MPQLRAPTQCHFWHADDPNPGGDDTELVKSFEDESHLFRALFRCKNCGQLYFYEWSEEIDWVHGDDPQYQTWVPVEEQDVDDLLKANIWTVRAYTPRIINDPRRDGTRKSGWIRGEVEPAESGHPESKT